MHKDDRIFAVVGACVVVAVALVAALMWLGSSITVDAPQRATVVVPPRSVPSPEASASPASQIIEVGEPDAADDGLLRIAVMRLSTHPELAAILVNDRLMRRFVLAVDEVAGGYSPVDQVEFLRPQRPFIVQEDEGRLVIASGTYRRYDLVADVVASIDSDAAVEIYRQFRPRLEAVYREVGWANDDFDTRLREAIDHLLEVEPPSGGVEVEQRAIVYAFADDRFEDMSEAQKQLLRMGPHNIGAVQAKLLELRERLGWPPRAPAVTTAELEEANDSAQSETSLIADAATVLEPEPAVDPIGASKAP